MANGRASQPTAVSRESRPNESQLAAFYAAISDFSGIDVARHFSEVGKEALLRRMRELRVPAVGEYLEFLEREGAAELQRLLPAFVVPQSHFFRDAKQFAVLRDVLPGMAAAFRPQPIRMWSAGCANGAEPYSMAVTGIQAAGGNFGHPPTVLASDILSVSIEQAERGRFDPVQVEGTPSHVFPLLFTRDDGVQTQTTTPVEGLVVRREVRKLVRFKKENILKANYSSCFHVVFCRNLVMYFSQRARAEAYRVLHDSLVPGGLLFAGHSDAIGRYERLFAHVADLGAAVFCRAQDVEMVREMFATGKPAAPPESKETAEEAEAYGEEDKRAVDGRHFISAGAVLEAAAGEESEGLATLRSQLRTVLQRGADQVVLEAANVERMDKVATDMIARAARLLDEKGARFRITLRRRDGSVNRRVAEWLERRSLGRFIENHLLQADTGAHGGTGQ